MKLITNANNISSCMEFELEAGESVKAEQAYAFPNEQFVVTEVIGSRGRIVAVKVDRDKEYGQYHVVGEVATKI